MPKTRTIETETARVRALQDKEASRYDRQMSFFDRVLFAGGREWACSHTAGEVLELAIGTGRNLTPRDHIRAVHDSGSSRRAP